MKYELSFIISPAIAETDHTSVNQEALDYLKGIDAKITREPYFMGRRKLAYPIAKQKHGFYVCLEFEVADGKKLPELDTKLKHNTSLLRYLIIRLENRTQNVTVDFAKMEERDRAKTKVMANKKSKTPTTRAPFKRETYFSKSKPEATQPKVRLEDIDKRLDEILEDPKID